MRTDEVLGHQRVMTQLRSADERDALHHAYLFVGPQSVGKHTVAVHIAKMVNCESTDPARRPCGVCGTCKQIDAGAHPDVITVEPEAGKATPTISVAQIREVVRKTGYHRYNARRRVVIIDPAEAMNDPAANALLKTLEEPPDGTGFIVIATNATALLPTIRSRCQQIRFSAVSEDAIVEWLKASEVPDARLVARLCHGCPGRALTLSDGGLDKRKAVRDDVLRVIGSDLGDIFAWSSKLTGGSGRSVWAPKVNSVLDTLDELIRDAAVLGSGADLSLINADAPDVVQRWADALWPGGTTRCANATQEARIHLRHNVGGRLVVEAVVTRIATELGAARLQP